jgi:hypothetical protein
MRSVDVHAEFVGSVAEVLQERVPGLITRAERSRFRLRIGRSRVFRRS